MIYPAYAFTEHQYKTRFRPVAGTKRLCYSVRTIIILPPGKPLHGIRHIHPQVTPIFAAQGFHSQRISLHPGIRTTATVHSYLTLIQRGNKKTHFFSFRFSSSKWGKKIRTDSVFFHSDSSHHPNPTRAKKTPEFVYTKKSKKKNPENTRIRKYEFIFFPAC